MAASASDVRSALSLPYPSPAPGPSQPRKTTNARKPDGIPRELYALIGPSAPTLTAQLAKPRLKQKPNLGGGGKVKWEWREFKNSARPDSLRLSHWAKAGTDPDTEYPFAKYNIQQDVYVYSQDEYNRLLEDQDWTKEETDYLFDLVREYDSRFYIVGDRYDFPDGPPRTLEDLKERYYSVCRKLVRNRPWAGDAASRDRLVSSLQFDHERETTRKKYVASLGNRTQEQIVEEEALYIELKRLEQNERKFKKERDELLRTLLGIESGLADVQIDDDGLNTSQTDSRKKRKMAAEPETPVSAAASPSVISLNQPVPKKAQTAKSAAYDALHCIHRTEVPASTSSVTKNAHQAAYLRSQKLPPTKSAALPKIAQVLGELGISHTRLVMPTRDNCQQLENLIDAASALIETKKLVDKVEQDIRIAKERLAMPDDGADEAGDGEGAATPMDVDGSLEGGDGDGDGDERAQSVVSTRSTRSRKQTRRSMSISSVDTSTTGPIKRQKRY